jgi:hypothetical protein
VESDPKTNWNPGLTQAATCELDPTCKEKPKKCGIRTIKSRRFEMRPTEDDFHETRSPQN